MKQVHLNAITFAFLVLTREQASVAARALVTINGLANAAAAKGDESAAQAVKIYRSQK